MSLIDHPQPSSGAASPRSDKPAARTAWLAFVRLPNLPLIATVVSVAVMLINAVVVVRIVQRDREKVIADTISDNSNLVTAFDEYVTRTFGIADAVTQLLKSEFAKSGAAVNLAQLAEQHAFDAHLITRASIIDEHGALISSTDRLATDAALIPSAATELAFNAATASDAIHIGVPTRQDGSALVPISRRVTRANGTFAGVVLLEIESVRFTEFYAEVPRRAGDVMALIGLDGFSRVRLSGQSHTAGENVQRTPVFAEQTRRPAGNLTAPSSVDGAPCLISYRTLGEFPFIVAVAVSEKDALAEAESRKRSLYLRAAILTALIAVFAFLLVRALSRWKHAVSSLKTSEAALRAREDDFRVITESMPQLVWMAEADGTHSYFNQQWLDYTGLTLAQCVGDGWKVAFDPAEQERAIERWHQAVAEGEVYEAEYRLRRADGTYRWMLGRALPVRDSEGRVTKWFGTSTDINRQVVAQAQLREAQQVAHVGSWSRDSVTGFDSWSEELYHICGVSPAEFTPTLESISELIHPDDRAQYYLDRGRSGATMTSYQREMRIVRPDGEVRSLHHNVAVDANGSGTPPRVHGTVQDVTESRAAERQLRQQANLLNLTRDAIIVREMDDTIRFWSHGAEGVYGWTAEEVLGRRASDFCYVDRPKFMRAKRILAERGEWSGELEHFCKDGSIVTMSSRWSAVTDEQTGVQSVLVINANLTEQKKLEQQLLRHQRLESIGTLASGVAHDLNNILAPILMAAPLLRQDMPAAKRAQLVTLFEKCAERGASIVRQVLTFARGADGERVLMQPIYALRDLAEIIAETFPKSITVHTAYPEDLPLIEADPTQLHQVLLNLCVNARDAMPDGGMLTLSAETFEVDEHYAAMTPGATAGPHLLIQVSDTGTGIRPDVMEKIFDPFFTTKGIGNGTGLGLSTALGVVKDHHGAITVESNARGTTFRVLLPVAEVPLELDFSDTHDELPQGHGETILVVDDEEAIRLVAEPLLRKHGYKVLLAPDGPAALATFAAHSAEIAVVLTDLAMPIMSGIALARTIRKMQPEACIIISAGREDDCVPSEMEEIGVAATLPKPYTQAALLRLLDQVISQNRKPI